MPSVAEILDAIPDAFLPQMLRGQLAEAEHFVRYRWIARQVSGKRVLDVGCGTGHGSLLLAQAGAQEVVGIDREPMLIEAAPTELAGAVELRHMEAERLDFPNDCFDVVVAFGLLHKIEDKPRVVNELLRVLSPDGEIAVSVGDEDGETEAETTRIAAMMRASERNVRVVYQRNWMTSAIIEEDIANSDHRQPLREIEVHKLAPAAESSGVAMLLWGTRGESRQVQTTCAITHAFAPKRWLERSAALEGAIAERVTLEEGLRRAESERDELADHLIELEQRIARASGK
ncbi:MAG TPA: class I SAM-dependent methyltransferase [Solirubrobacteraceae bacterium]|jgi:ubiquinone/menaquinone biosynthesis C-methylase UbiE